jgi:hypothetical protein
MIHALTCLLFPLFGGCAPFVEYAATPSALIADPPYYSGRPVIVTGSVARVRQLRGASFGTLAETFYLCNGQCVQVFMREHTSMFEGERLSVRGFFSANQRVGKLLLHNDIDAAEIFPRV